MDTDEIEAWLTNEKTVDAVAKALWVYGGGTVIPWDGSAPATARLRDEERRRARAVLATLRGVGVEAAS